MVLFYILFPANDGWMFYSDGTSQSSSPTHPFGIAMAIEATAQRVQSMIAASSSSAHYPHGPNAALQQSHKSRSFSANALYASSGSIYITINNTTIQ